MIFFAVAMLPALNWLVVVVLAEANRVPDTGARGINLELVLVFAVKGRDSKRGIGIDACVDSRWPQAVVAVVMALLGIVDRRICLFLRQ